MKLRKWTSSTFHRPVFPTLALTLPLTAQDTSAPSTIRTVATEGSPPGGSPPVNTGADSVDGQDATDSAVVVLRLDLAGTATPTPGSS